MFTGIIEEIGKIDSIQKDPDSVKFHIVAETILDDLEVDHSISINGCCLTVTEVSKRGFAVRAINETLQKTTLGKLGEGANVNLERAVRLSGRLGGHIVQGHIDTTGVVESITDLNHGAVLWIKYPKQFSKWLIAVGSIAVNGVSLTVADLSDHMFKAAIIPHTLRHTTFGEIQVGDQVNLEFDVIAKYIERLTDIAAKW